jgi:RNA polymerase sigma-70 factor, ECF subfamily
MIDRDSISQPGVSTAEATSASLLGRIKSGEGEAWVLFVELYAPLLYEWCRRNGLQAEDAADVAQEVFAAVSRNIEGFRRDRPGDSFRGWLWTIARNKINDFHRARKRLPEARGGTEAQVRMAGIAEPLLSPSKPSLHQSDGNSLERRAIELVQAGVELRTWQAFWRVAVEGEEVPEVAKSLGISIQAVYDAKYRIRRKVRQELDGLID